MACYVTFASASADQRASSHRSKAFISLVQVSATSAGRPGAPAISSGPGRSVVDSAWSLHLSRTTRWLTRCLSNVRIREIMMRRVMRRKIGAAIAALLLLSGSSFMSFAQTGGPPSAGQKGVAGSPKAEGIGSTSSTHNPSGSSSSTTGMENRTGTGSGMGTNTSTHNPSGKND
jgi:hypothetical protein